jgi:hypothetical protein
MAALDATFDRTAEDGTDNSPPKRPRRAPAKGAGRQAPRRPAPAPSEGPWRRAWRVAMIVTLVALVAAGVTTHLAGHAPSWRSLTVICLQSLPLLPGLVLFWRLLEALRARYAATPLALWLGLALIGTVGVMLLFPGIVFAIHSRSVAFAEDNDGEMKLVHHLIGTASAFYLYGTTAFRLWWPWGALVPVLTTILFWRTHRR